MFVFGVIYVIIYKYGSIWVENKVLMTAMKSVVMFDVARCVIPVLMPSSSDKKLKPPFGLMALKGVDVSKIVNGRSLIGRLLLLQFQRGHYLGFVNRLTVSYNVYCYVKHLVLATTNVLSGRIMFLVCSYICLCVCPCVPNVVNRISSKMLDIFSPNC